jgi:bacterioferritin-associated ferredoxin
MANYFPVANVESAYAWPGNETDLHDIQQRPGEPLRSFVQRFSKVRNTIPRISNASVVVAFCQGVRDEKMLEKLATHDVQDVSALFSLADKCAKAMRAAPGTLHQELKRYLTSPLVMVVPEPGEPLLLYIVATSEVVSMVLVIERQTHTTYMSSGALLPMGQGPRT